MFSPSDLTQYSDSPFSSWMEHLAKIHPELLPTPDEEDAMMALLQKKGVLHERETLALFVAKGLRVVDLSQISDAVNATLNAMQSGADVIYQATLQQVPFWGRADFLVKVPGTSLWGNFQYEIWDTKVSKSLKPYFLIQLCCYADMLEGLQGVRPQEVVVVLGNSEQKRFRTNDYYYYYQNLKKNFLKMHEAFSLDNRPDPADSNGLGRWTGYAQKLLKESDHLMQVATITQGQIKKLQKVGIVTMQALANTEGVRVPGMNSAIFERLKAQASIQKASEGREVPLYQILPANSSQKQGLALLPPGSPGDLFFDIEGYPLAEGGLEYLWGVSYFDESQKRQYRDFWAHDSEEEKQTFSNFIQFAYNRWIQEPTLHIYHYANYEIAACRKLMGRYGVCESEVDQLLRNEVFVDLYKVVKGSLLLGEPKYSIKNVEHLYRPKRSTEVGSGGDSVVVYERWRENPDGKNWETSKILKDIRDYNIDDCHSTQELVDWLRLRQQEQSIVYLGKTEVVQPELPEEINERILLRDRLLEKAATLEKKGFLEEAQVVYVLGWSLEFHRREAKPVFWRLFDRKGLGAEELHDDPVCLAQCRRTQKPPQKPTEKARQLAYEYTFDPNQEFKGTSQRYYVLGQETSEGKNVTVNLIPEGSRLEQGFIQLQMKDELETILGLIPDEYVRPDPIPEAITQQAKAFEQGLLEPSALVDFLKK